MSINLNIIKIWNELDKVENTQGTKNKQELLKQIIDDIEFKKFIFPALNNKINTQYSEDSSFTKEEIIEYSKTLDEEYYKSEHFVSLYDSLIFNLNDRQITGNLARNEIKKILAIAHLINNSLGYKWTNRCLIKKLRMGLNLKNISKLTKINITEKLFNELESAEDTEEFTNIKKIKDVLDNPTDYIIEPKIDGERLVAIFKDNKIQFLSRRGKPKENLINLENQLMEMYSYFDGMVLDGEVYSSSWNESRSILSSKNKEVDTSNLNFICFDLFPIEVFTEKDFSSLKLLDRKRILASAFIHTDSEKIKNIELISFSYVEKQEDILKYYKECLRNGYEGSMLKNKNSIYKCKRTKDWLKIKEIKSEEFLCVDINEGNGSNKNRVGSLVILLENGNHCNVSGLSEKDRIDFWNTPTLIVGKYIEVKFQERTITGSLRNPRFVKIRDDLDI